MVELPTEALIAHIISTFRLIRPKQLSQAYSQCKSFEKLWIEPFGFAPHIISMNEAAALNQCRLSNALEIEIVRLNKAEINLCSYGDSLYPKLLMQIHSPPLLLYYRGNIQMKDFPLAVIGSRKMSGYGAEAIETLLSGFSGLPISIISGMALGADAQAHSVALRKNLHTVAILGSGIDNPSIYPRSHISLAQKILSSGGGIISEHPPSTMAHPGFFPMRNRIIAGISRAVLVAEANKKSGTLITAYSALESGRDVWAVPGSIFSALSSGTNQLIAKGAYPALSSEIIIDSYPELANKKISVTHPILQKIIEEEQSRI